MCNCQPWGACTECEPALKGIGAKPAPASAGSVAMVKIADDLIMFGNWIKEATEGITDFPSADLLDAITQRYYRGKKSN